MPKMKISGKAMNIGNSSKLIAGLVFSLSAFSSNGQPSVFGEHEVTMSLSSVPAKLLLELLSDRSKANEKNVSDEIVWEVQGTDLLDGITLDLQFTTTPMFEVVPQVLSCIGFNYREVPNGIEIEKGSNPTEIQCKNVTLVESVESVESIPSEAEPLYSWTISSTSIRDFIDLLSAEIDTNIIAASHTTELDQLRMQVSVIESSESLVVERLFECMGWSYFVSKVGIFAQEVPDGKPPEQCKEFIFLP